MSFRRADIQARSHTWLEIIGALKLLKGACFVVLGFALLRMLHHDIYMFALQAVEALHLDPDRLLIARLLDRVSLVSAHRIKQLSGLVFLYASLDFIEGSGLMLRKRWAEYLTLIVTIALLPIEVVKMIRHPNHWTALILIASILLVAYLAWLVRDQNRGRGDGNGDSAPRVGPERQAQIS